MSRPCWVLDINVFVSAALSPSGPCSELIALAADGHFTPAWDNHVLREYRDVLGRPVFKLSAGTRRRLLEALPLAGGYEGRPGNVGLPDRDDEVFLAVALATPDRVIVTGNVRHFPAPIMKRLNVRVVTPRQAVDQLAGRG